MSLVSRDAVSFWITRNIAAADAFSRWVDEHPEIRPFHRYRTGDSFHVIVGIDHAPAVRAFLATVET